MTTDGQHPVILGPKAELRRQRARNRDHEAVLRWAARALGSEWRAPNFGHCKRAEAEGGAPDHSAPATIEERLECYRA
jgi:hypothetical protein